MSHRDGKSHSLQLKYCLCSAIHCICLPTAALAPLNPVLQNSFLLSEERQETVPSYVHAHRSAVVVMILAGLHTVEEVPIQPSYQSFQLRRCEVQILRAWYEGMCVRSVSD